MSELYACEFCGRRYRADKIARCPGCSEEPKSGSLLVEKEANHIFGVAKQSKVKGEASDLVEAQNRTTHAIRSVAVLVFFSVFWTGLVGVLVTLSILTQAENCQYGFCMRVNTPASTAFIILALIAAIAGVWVTLAAGFNELRKSRVNSTWL